MCVQLVCSTDFADLADCIMIYYDEMFKKKVSVYGHVDVCVCVCLPDDIIIYIYMTFVVGWA